MKQSINFKLNSKNVTVEVQGDESLLTVIRTYLDETGTKYGCGLGDCGACTVLVNNEVTRSCMTFIEDVANKEIITIEGIGTSTNLHPIQEAFVKTDALQCGFCTPGMIMNAYGLLLKNPNPTREEIITAMDTNLCRCGSYGRIIEAIEKASKQLSKTF
ncbi:MULTISPECIES: (2Fe-2S)-binding protein [Flavobacteriaceae]|uniref:(2Fe-2S)-binding protein n=2 Tax=Flavobacteriaceae TaxID=49546 RepID=A0A4Y8ARP6_9FLAO|nr:MULTISPECIES: (2Fe-2S)-binding protein [Flavobacteriaceae]TEW73870.1 (2Fe-2S)-binding protein [Gramella jeungdoensis]GGK38258.1 (2Fe-2S)-binding protein [Lutibacter litoralis]